MSAGSSGRPQRRLDSVGDRIFLRTTQGFALLVVGVALLAFVTSARQAVPSFVRFGPGFLTATTWNPVKEAYGAAPFLWGTLYSSLVALLIAVPVGIGTAVFLSELSPRWLSGPVSFLVELLAAVPSVVYGLWGVLVMAPWLHSTVQQPLHRALGNTPFFAGPPQSRSMLAASVVLAVMVLPIIAAITRDVLQAVPRAQREASMALGGTPWETIWRSVLPFGRVGILGAIVLALGRALGETMAVTMLIGNKPDLSVSLLSPAYTLASVLANEFAEATGALNRAALYEITVVLFLLTFIVNGLARALVLRVARQERGQ